MNRLLRNLVIDGFALWIAIRLVPGIHSPEGFVRLFLTALLFAVIRAFIRPLFVLLSFPLLVITVGPLLLLLNASFVLLYSRLAEFLGLGFIVEGLLPAMEGAITMSIVRLFLAECIWTGQRQLAFRKEKTWIRILEGRNKWLRGQIADAKKVYERGEPAIQMQKSRAADAEKNILIPGFSAEEE